MGPFARALIEGTELLKLPLVSLGIFLATFAMIAIRAFRMDRALVRDLEHLPLADSDRKEV